MTCLCDRPNNSQMASPTNNNSLSSPAWIFYSSYPNDSQCAPMLITSTDPSSSVESHSLIMVFKCCLRAFLCTYSEHWISKCELKELLRWVQSNFFGGIVRDWPWILFFMDITQEWIDPMTWYTMAWLCPWHPTLNVGKVMNTLIGSKCHIYAGSHDKVSSLLPPKSASEILVIWLDHFLDDRSPFETYHCPPS